MQSPQNKLQAMMQGLMGGGNAGAQQQMDGAGPGPQPPSANQPSGMPQSNDPAYPGFVKLKRALKSLAEMLNQLGDIASSTQVEKMAIELGELGEKRMSDFAKKAELEQKLGSAGTSQGGQPQGAPPAPAPQQ